MLSELFVVEGLSAREAVEAASDPVTQSVIALQGKPLNAMRASPKRIAEHTFYAALAEQLWKDHEQLHPRFSKVIILCDPDPDGVHISALILAYFLKMHPRLLDLGLVFMVRVPCVQVVVQNSGKRREFLGYADTETTLLRDIRAASLEIVSKLRFRGLASIPPRLLARTCIASETRSIMPVSTDDALAMTRIFGITKR
ncbi:MAG: hypothetical protein Aurels2KO_44920 [Aureliella sp.]